MSEVKKLCEAVIERAEKATPGKWELHIDSCDCGGGYPCGHPDWVHCVTSRAVPEKNHHGFKEVIDGSMDMADGEFIAHSRTDAPLLAKMLMRAEEALREYVEILEKNKSYDCGNYCCAGAGGPFPLDEALREIEEMARGK